MQIFRKIMSDLNTDCWFTLLVLLLVMEILKKNNKKSSENDQLTGHFQSFF